MASRDGKKVLKASVRAALFLAASATMAWAEDVSNGIAGMGPKYMADAPQPETNWVDQVKNPVPWFKWGADERMRWEFLHNPFLLDVDPPGHEWSFLRMRTRLWGSVTPVKDIDINGRLTWEWRYWFTPESKDEWDWGNVLPDQLNVRAKLGPATLTLGRQDIIMGDGWLVLEGAPLDGSTTIYFDAARLSVDIKDCQTAVDGIFIYQFSRVDEWMGPIASHHMPQIEQDETGAILWVANKSIKNTEVDGYFIYKHDDARLANGDEADIYTPGARVNARFNENWAARLEGAYQAGNKNDRDLNAWGTTGRVTYFFNDSLKNQVHVGAEFLSGDNPGTKTDEQFDPLWGRWPQFSELYVYTYAPETRIAQTTDLFRVNAGWQADPTNKLMLKADYNALFAPENSHRGAAGFTNSGSFRGHLLTGMIAYKFNRYLSGHLLGEILFPGDYYEETDSIGAFDTRRDFASYFRIEMVVTF